MLSVRFMRPLLLAKATTRSGGSAPQGGRRRAGASRDGLARRRDGRARCREAGLGPAGGARTRLDAVLEGLAARAAAAAAEIRAELETDPAALRARLEGDLPLLSAAEADTPGRNWPA